MRLCTVADFVTLMQNAIVAADTVPETYQ